MSDHGHNWRENGIRVIPGNCLEPSTAATPGMSRIVARDGGLSGYRWGLGRKQALLARERDAKI